MASSLSVVYEEAREPHIQVTSDRVGGVDRRAVAQPSTQASCISWGLTFGSTNLLSSPHLVGVCFCHLSLETHTTPYRVSSGQQRAPEGKGSSLCGGGHGSVVGTLPLSCVLSCDVSLSGVGGTTHFPLLPVGSIWG
jgi:hypothetical protein